METHDSEIVVPDATSLISSLRAIGYSLETAIADIVDNSIDAKATVIKIDMVWDSEKNYIRIQDNGFGMDEQELLHAMKIGSVHPNTQRKPGTLGRFGMGLKTASFSIGKRLTVLTKKNEQSFIRCWDLEYISNSNNWSLLKNPFSPNSAEILDRIKTSTGTIVLIEELDRVINLPFTDKKAQKFYNKIKIVEDHLAMIFHRFLEGPNKIQIYLNGNQVKAWDPFLTHEIATQELPTESISIKGDIIRIQPYILPHHSKLTQDEYNLASGPRGWLEQQGFYIYRNKRLLVAGSWLHLFSREEAYKLARIKLDITNRSDFEWQIDIKKSNAKPPQELISFLRKIGEKTRKKSHEVFYQRSVRKTFENNSIMDHIWEQVSTKNNSYFRLNRNNNYLRNLFETNEEYLAKLKFYLFHVEEYCPANVISFNVNKPLKVLEEKITNEQRNKIKLLLDIFREKKLSLDEIINQIVSYDSFSMCSKDELKKTVYKLTGGNYV